MRHFPVIITGLFIPVIILPTMGGIIPMGCRFIMERHPESSLAPLGLALGWGRAGKGFAMILFKLVKGDSYPLFF